MAQNQRRGSAEVISVEELLSTTTKSKEPKRQGRPRFEDSSTLGEVNTDKNVFKLSPDVPQFSIPKEPGKDKRAKQNERLHVG